MVAEHYVTKYDGCASGETLVTPQWLEEHRHDPALRVVEVDVSPAAYDSGHIGGAVLWNVYSDLKDSTYQLAGRAAIENLLARSGISPDSTVVLYGYAPAMGVWLMKLYGHADVRMLDCARGTWQEEGRPWASAAASPVPTRYLLPGEDDRIRVGYRSVEDAIGDPALAIVDVRTEVAPAKPCRAEFQKKFGGNSDLAQCEAVDDVAMNSAQEMPSGLARADGSAIRVLVVDDEPTLAEVLASVLRYEGWEVRTAADGSSAVRTAREFQPDAVILDIMLPDFDGLEVLRRLRTTSPHICVLFLTAKDSVEDRIAGITAGGDDYVTKPFSLEEVLARLRGLLRRAGVARSATGSLLVVGDLTMDEDAREVRRDGQLIDLTATEFELLRYLMLNPKRVLSKAQILDRVWNYDFGGQAHVVELYISYVRKKIDAGRDPMIQTVRGVGYVLRPSAE